MSYVAVVLLIAVMVAVVLSAAFPPSAPPPRRPASRHADAWDGVSFAGCLARFRSHDRRKAEGRDRAGRRSVWERFGEESDTGPRYRLAPAPEFAAVRHPDLALEPFLAVTAGLPYALGDVLRARSAQR
ncbi:hypothetical protein [Actinomadura macrotermitis]|uniref:hypothetical protein n=1 Tax=Actinomadura macrotermitis TaxID=2585200 RepID=UPI0012968390|nr:hypothetical protein [Actinomadura macrotermitis]